MRTEHIGIQKGLGKSITVGVLQLKSPFFDEIDEVWEEEGHVFAITTNTEQNYRKRIEKIKKILEKLESQEHIDILVFPEYAFLKDDRGIIGANESTIQICQKFSNKMKTIVVGNYYDRTNRASVSFVALPDGYAPNNMYTAIRQTVSTYNDNVLKSVDKIKKEDEKVLKFWWKPDGEETKAYFQILACKDYLYFTGVEPLREWPDIISVYDPGVIISPMSTPEIKTFESRAIGLVRDIKTETGAKSIVSILCNATSMPKQEKSDICGQSQIISPIDMKEEIKPLLKRGVEGIIIATINPFKSIIRPTPIERESNAVLLSSKIYEIIESENNTIDLREIGASIKHIGVVAHPKVLNDLGLRKIYGFMRVDDYQGIKERVNERFKHFKEMSIPMHGIYGIHDILTFSYEEFYDDQSGKEILKTRLWPIIKDDVYFDEDHFGCCIVDNVTKYRGEDLSEKKPNSAMYRGGKGKETRLRLRSIALGEEVEDQLINKLKVDNILIETPFDTSDISDKEKNDGMLEFLIVVTIVPFDRGPAATGIHGEFEKCILPDLINDERIRTIEKIHSEGKGFVEGDYILHVVGDLDDLNEVVIGKVHRGFEGGRCGTRVIIPAESLSDNRYPCLTETETIKTIEAQIIDIFNHWKKLEIDDKKMMQEIVPSAIKLLDEKTRSNVLSIYYHADELSKHISDNDNWMKDMYSLIYGVTCAITQQKIGLVIDEGRLSNFCRDFSNDIGKAIERNLIKIFENLAERRKIQVGDIETILNKAIKAVKGTEGRVNIGTMVIGTAAFALESLSGLCTKEKYKKNIEKEFGNMFNDDESKIKQQMEYLDIICTELFKKHLFELDLNAKQHLNPGGVDEELREIFKNEEITLSSNARISKIDEKNWKISDIADKYVIEESDDQLNIYFEVITMDMVNGIRSFSEGSRNLTSHTEYGKIIHPKQVLNATYSGLKFLEKINFVMKER